MAWSLGNPLAGKGSPGFGVWLLEEESWVSSRLFRAPVHEKGLEESHVQGFTMTWDQLGRCSHAAATLLPRRCCLPVTAAVWGPAKSLKRFNLRER